MREQRELVASLVRRRGEQLRAGVLDVVLDAEPAYRALAPEQLQEVQAIAMWALDRLVECWCTDQGLAEADRARLRGIGAARARDGRAPGAVLRAYRAGALAAVDVIFELGDGHLDQADAQALARSTLIAVDAASEAITDGYTAAHHQLDEDRDRALRNLIDDVLVGRHSSSAAFAARCRQLQVELTGALQLLVVAIDDPAADAAQLVRDLSIDGVPPPHLLTTRGSRAVLIVPGDLEVPGSLRPGGWRGCLLPAADGAAVADAYALAVVALDYAPDHAYVQQPLLTEGDAHVLALLTGRPAADPGRAAATVLRALLEPRNDHLLAGLEALFAAGNAIEAAHALHLHPQTLRYRIARARQISGRDPRDPWQRLTLEVAQRAWAACHDTSATRDPD
ncbi:PucR family transcriptional regulator [Actinokineospora bangkokensis]|uniref:Uncharacterized protein n=1 Tax=Actinokineospora bangkokensis TaxID=1193682 RepID=A0A1Q9LIZ5_9PSEU|nr:helix-turn-helix domain-containing protein [Actinokineospora bangkokensis]OLR91949.1 hypothetical protein BJP25_24310 [Actinokineospora bangkokensis]